MKRCFFIIRVLTSLSALLLLAACAVNPVTGEKELSIISESQEILMGQRNFGPYVQQFNALYQNDAIQDYVERVGNKLAQVSHRPNMPFEFVVVNSSIVNAWAIPGGKIAVTRGLLSKMKNEAELAAVLGHEIGHVAAKHTVRRMQTAILWSALLMTSDIILTRQSEHYREHRPLYTTAGMLGLQLGLASYSRDHESQSDGLGVEYMMKAGFHPSGMVDLQQILMDMDKEKSYITADLFRSHPHSYDRYVKAKEAVAKNAALIGKKNFIMNEKDFTDVVVDVLQKEKSAYDTYDKATELAAKGQWRGAIAQYRDAINLKPTEALFHADLGNAFVMLFEDREADRELQKASELYPDFFKPRFYMGRLYFLQKNFGNSLYHLEEADKLIPQVPIVRYMLAVCHQIMGNTNRAIDFYQEVYGSPSAPNDIRQKAGEELIKLGVLKKPGDEDKDSDDQKDKKKYKYRKY